MNSDLLYALVVFAFVTSITPGPNNLMLMASGANFGFRRTLPHMLGIGIGFTIMLVLVGLGLIQLFDAWPTSYDILKVLSVLYMLWLAWKTATAAGLSRADGVGKPMTFLQAAAFQWVNPKAWAMSLTAMTAYAPDRAGFTILIVALIFGLVNFPSVSVWTVLGQQMARLLTNHARRVVFNVMMAALLLASLIPVLWP
jgi:threonine/homoserine/homoserine lactone efflux protein